MRKSILAYIVLVGLPIIGVAGVLRAGRDLVPPVDLEGGWSIEWHQQAVSSECPQAPEEMAIEQSGTRITLRTGSRLRTGGFHADSLSLSRVRGCPAATSFRARLTGVRGYERLVGQMVLPECACRQLTFSASRMPGK